jgi:hypothetical protein
MAETGITPARAAFIVILNPVDFQSGKAPEANLFADYIDPAASR